MLLTIGLTAYVTGLLLLLYLIYLVLKGLSGTTAVLKIAFGASAIFFLLLAAAGVSARFFARSGTLNYYGIDVLAGLFALAAFGAFRFFQIVGKADSASKMMAGLQSLEGPGKTKRRATFRTRFVLNPRGNPKAENAFNLIRSAGGTDAPAIKDGEHAWHARAVRFSPDGDLLAPIAPKLDEMIASACAAGPVKVVLDLTKVTSMDSAVVETIVSCYRRYRDSRFTIVAPPDSGPYRALALLGVDQLIPIEPTLTP